MKDANCTCNDPFPHLPWIPKIEYADSFEGDEYLNDCCYKHFYYDYLKSQWAWKDDGSWTWEYDGDRNLYVEDTDGN